MRNAENNNDVHSAAPAIIIEGGGKSYKLYLEGLSNFLYRVQERVQISSVDDLTSNLNIIADLVLDGTPDDFEVIELKHSLKLLRELTYLFNELLIPRS